MLISHPGVGNDTLAALKGKPILVGAAGRTSFWPFLKAKFGFTEDQARPYTFNMAPFLADKQVSQQGFLSSEPYAIEQAGVKPVIHLLADAGFENYNTTINISRKMVDEKKDLVQRFVTASLEGWAEYMKDGPGNAAANALIKKGQSRHGRRQDRPRDQGDEPVRHRPLRRRAEARHRRHDRRSLGQVLRPDDAGGRLPPANLDIKKAYSLEFVNKGVGV